MSWHGSQRALNMSWHGSQRALQNALGTVHGSQRVLQNALGTVCPVGNIGYEYKFVLLVSVLSVI